LRAGEIHGGWNKEDSLKWEDFTLVPDGKEKPFLSLPFVGKMKSSRNVDLPPILAGTLLKAKEGNLDDVPSKNGVNLWKKLRKESGLSSIKQNTLRHTAIRFFYRHNPVTNEETLDESLMTKQFVERSES